MAIKYFLLYIGVFLVGAVALVFVARSFTPGLANNTKKPALQGGLSAVVASGAAFGATMISNHLFTIFWIFAAVFLIFGIIHILYFHNRYFYSNTQNRNKATTGEIVFMLAILFFIIVVFSSLQYFLKNKSFLYFPMLMSMLAFFIPLSVYYCFNAAFNIPPSEFPVWQYPSNHTIELPDEQPNEKVLVIAFEACKNAADSEKTNFRAKGPETMKLGDLYYHFINDYNEFQSETPIQYTDLENQQQEWWFCLKPKWYQPKRILNPDLSIRENRIRENSVIICERI